MKISFTRISVPFAAAACLVLSGSAAGQHATHVVSYTPGTGVAIDFETSLPMNVAGAALHEPSRFTPDPGFPGIVSPFSPAYKRNQLVSIGADGELTLRLSNYAIPQPGVPEIGIFSNAGITLDFDALPDLRAATPATTFGDDFARVEVSENGIDWVDLGLQHLAMPANGYTDLSDPFSETAGGSESDFQQPFVAASSDFDGLDYPGMVTLLNGSGGGAWLDISSAGVSQVGYVRFSLASNATWSFELDGVSVSHAALGAAVVPEPGSLGLAIMAAAAMMRRLRLRA